VALIRIQNKSEVDAVVLIARKYKTENRKYRVITPYDAQRDAIEKALRAEGLKWEDCVFNVDSFQG
jgi:superfamily I DNA and/or RNA helicase